MPASHFSLTVISVNSLELRLHCTRRDSNIYHEGGFCLGELGALWICRDLFQQG